MTNTAKSFLYATDNAGPTHSVSLFPSWLTREEWEEQGFPNISDAEQKERLERRVSFFRAIDSREEFTTVAAKRDTATDYCEEFLLRGYLEGKEGRVYECFQGSALIQPGYLADDADSLWIFSAEALVSLNEIAESLGLFIIKRREQEITSND